MEEITELSLAIETLSARVPNCRVKNCYPFVEPGTDLDKKGVEEETLSPHELTHRLQFSGRQG